MRLIRLSGAEKGVGERNAEEKKVKEESILTVAAPLTCTDLLAVDSVPGTRSTDSCTSFGFTSGTFTSLKQTRNNNTNKTNT